MQNQILLNGIEVAELKDFIKQAVLETRENLPQSKPKPTYYSRHEVAELLGIHVNTVDNLRREGKLNFSRIGRALRISQDNVQSLLDNQKNEI